jgi:hypothetical protein
MVPDTKIGDTRYYLHADGRWTSVSETSGACSQIKFKHVLGHVGDQSIDKKFKSSVSKAAVASAVVLNHY